MRIKIRGLEAETNLQKVKEMTDYKGIKQVKFSPEGESGLLLRGVNLWDSFLPRPESEPGEKEWRQPGLWIIGDTSPLGEANFVK